MLNHFLSDTSQGLGVDRTYDFSAELNSSVPPPLLHHSSPAINRSVTFPATSLSPVSARNPIASPLGPHIRMPPPPMVASLSENVQNANRTTTSALIELIPL